MDYIITIRFNSKPTLKTTKINDKIDNITRNNIYSVIIWLRISYATSVSVLNLFGIYWLENEKNILSLRKVKQICVEIVKSRPLRRTCISWYDILLSILTYIILYKTKLSKSPPQTDTHMRLNWISLTPSTEFPRQYV